MMMMMKIIMMMMVVVMLVPMTMTSVVIVVVVTMIVLVVYVCDGQYFFPPEFTFSSYLAAIYTIQNKLRTNCSQTCQRQSFELNDLKF